MELDELKYEVKRLAYQGVRYDDIREKIEGLSSSSALVKDALSNVDFHIADYQIAKQAKSQLLNRMIIYGVLAGICVLLTLHTLIRRQRVSIFIALGMVGFSLKFYDLYQKRKRPLESFLFQNNLIKGQSKFRR